MIFTTRDKENQRCPQAARPQYWLHRLLLIGGLVLSLVAASTAWINVNPDTILMLVDLARAHYGSQFVAQIETIAFSAQDRLHQMQYQLTQATPTTAWAGEAVQQLSAASPAPSAATRVTLPHTGVGVAPSTTIVPTTLSNTGPGAAPEQADSSALPLTLSWSPYVVAADGTLLLERTLVTPDPGRPYVRTALVRIDLAHTQLHLVVGTMEPVSNIKQARPGTIPAAVLRSNTLLAAFNGGFKAANGQYGMASNGIAWLAAQPGLATLALYRDGTVRLGVWGQDMQASADMVAFRQNCPLLLDHATLTSEAENPTTALWGATVGNKVATWRSGLGMSADGRFLIYAVGDGLTVTSLAEALRQGGADRAMQLDINSFWTRFVTFRQQANQMPQAQKLLDAMQGDRQQFVAPDSRDFFYVTSKAW